MEVKFEFLEYLRLQTGVPVLLLVLLLLLLLSCLLREGTVAARRQQAIFETSFIHFDVQQLNLTISDCRQIVGADRRQIFVGASYKNRHFVLKRLNNELGTSSCQ